MPKTDQQFQIEQDARALVEAELIRQDKKRFIAATNHLSKEDKARAKAKQK